MKARKSSFLYRYRFVVGYVILFLLFFSALFILPNIAPKGLSQDEMDSVVAARRVNPLVDGNVVNMPYLLLQRLSIKLLGLSLISIKLPSIIIGTLAALFIILLLNRWFKSDVAVIGSIFTTLSTAFLFLAGSGTPAISYIFWLAFILWLGSKIVGNNEIKPIYIALFFIALALSVYTPHMCYVALCIAIAGLIHPHLRFSLKKLKFNELVICIAMALLIMAPLAVSVTFHPEIMADLVLMRDFSFNTFINNISNAFAPFFSFSMAYDSTYLAPLFGLASVALVVIGALASVGKLFTSRNTVVSLLIIFAIVFSGLNPAIAISVIVPFAILSSAGIESIFEKWHSLFPENPYAHFVGTAPVVVLIVVILVSSLSHYINGYRYTPRVAKNFDNDISLIKENLHNGDVLLVAEDYNFDFYKLLEHYNSITVQSELPNRHDMKIAVLGERREFEDLELQQIITSPKSRNSARLYIYQQSVAEATETTESNDSAEPAKQQ